VVASSWDNKIYSYSSSPPAKMFSSTIAHDDAVSSIDISSSGLWIASGSWDSSVKLWPYEKDRINQKTFYEFFGNTSSVHVVAIASTPPARVSNPLGTSLQSQLYVASGSEDGMVMVWRCSDQKLIFKYQASPNPNS
jgi:WD40 repeat protein